MSLEERVELLEKRIATLESERGAKKKGVEKHPGFGMFADNPVFEQMVEEGKKYRDSLDSDSNVDS
ncbi:MAG: hypothetical protein AAF226_04670 [Verrucomicrobiota bacterium]